MSLQALAAVDSRAPEPPHAALDIEVPDLRPLVSRISSEVAARLTRALEQLGDLADSTRTDGRLLQMVGDEIAGARRVGMLGQQIARLASGQVHPDIEPVVISDLLQSLIAQRRLADHPGFEIRADLARACIQCDASLASALLQCMLDWCIEHATSTIEFNLGNGGIGRGLQLTAELQVQNQANADSLDSLNWHLMFYTAQALGVRLIRQHIGRQVTISAQWMDTQRRSAPPMVFQAMGLPVAGCQVLVVAPERDLRNKIRLAIRGLDLLVDCVPSIDAAVRYCKDGLPEAVVYDGSLDALSVTRLRQALHADTPGLPFIEIAKTVAGIAPPGTRGVARGLGRLAGQPARSPGHRTGPPALISRQTPS